MKAVLEFNLPDDKYDFQVAVNGEEYLNTLLEIRERVRQIWKYRELTDGQYEIIDEVYVLVCDEITKLKQPSEL